MATLSTALQPATPPRPILNAFVQPRGLLGRIGGALMARSLPQQREVADMLTDPGPVLCELGSGPGAMGAILAERHPQLQLHLVDPSPTMRSQAGHRCHAWVQEGRVHISDGTAERLPLPEESCDTVLAVNSVALWPNLSAGPAEIHRVLRPGGQVVLSWHSGSAPSGTQRRLALPEATLDTLTDILRPTFDDVDRRDLVHSILWRASRCA